ncbi:MAG: peptide chain release factor 1 [Chloroflexi bacterium]|nr:peptide chain release factor 1 [Chloroflexota bacterium]
MPETATLFEKLNTIDRRYEELNRLMAQPEVATNIERLQELAREQASLQELVESYRQYGTTEKSLDEAKAMLDDGLDEEMQALVKEEIEGLRARRESLLQEIKLALLPKDPRDERDVIMEVRAGAGGDEAAIFAADLFRMYSRYAESRRWNVEVIDASENSLGGFKEIIFEVRGKGAYSQLKYESGVHRVQRVPVTEASGRIHTSTATVAVLPEAEEVDISINPDDLRVDIFHSGGAGGQNVNKVATAVRITHLPTGMVVTCQDERSQLRNRLKAMTVLRSRLLDIEQHKQSEQVASARRSQVGTGDRSEKIRTYNFPQDRVSDHRIGLTLHNLPRILDGELEGLIEAVATSEQAKALEEQLA